MGTKATVDQLNTLLRDELIAIDTYQQALEGRSAFSGKTELYHCLISHENRATALREQIVLLGGKPAESAGVRGVVANVLEGGAVAIGDTTALRTLEQFEREEMRDYQEHLEDLDPKSRRLVDTLMPQQAETLRTAVDLARRASKPS